MNSTLLEKRCFRLTTKGVQNREGSYEQGIGSYAVCSPSGESTKY